MKDRILTAVIAALISALLWYHWGYQDAKHKFCVHGESSITAAKINGQWMQSKPVRTGC